MCHCLKGLLFCFFLCVYIFAIFCVAMFLLLCVAMWSSESSEMILYENALEGFLNIQ